jgi:hypothetical protein
MRTGHAKVLQQNTSVKDLRCNASGALTLTRLRVAVDALRPARLRGLSLRARVGCSLCVGGGVAEVHLCLSG